jgi:RNA polymerase sigma-70 factor (ECF subfamily)
LAITFAMAAVMVELAPHELLPLAQQGDDEALGKLLAFYRSYLRLLARTQIWRRLQGKADPSDIVQDALVEAHEGFDRFRGTTEVEFAAWLRSILAGLIANHVRRFLHTGKRDARLERSLVSDLNDTSCHLSRQLISPQSSPSAQVLRREAAVELANALESLPEHYREVIVLRHLEDLSFAEVAGRMGRSVDSVEKIWVRSLAKLREVMAEKS